MPFVTTDIKYKKLNPCGSYELSKGATNLKVMIQVNDGTLFSATIKTYDWKNFNKITDNIFTAREVTEQMLEILEQDENVVSIESSVGIGPATH